MKRSRLVLLIVVAVAVLSHRSDGQQPRSVSEQLRLAAVMPGGAMLYIQARDLSALMRTWLASPVRSRFYKSASFTAFERSRINLKLQARQKDFEAALGFGISEERLAELAGGASSVALYDIGKLELVFVSEIPRERAIATVLFKNAPKFQERSGDGLSYYVRDITTDGGRLNQQFCFAYTDGKLIVTTAEGLMIRALKNAKAAASDSLIAAVIANAEAAGSGFATHDVTMWLDQAKLNKNRYFTANWIHGNAVNGRNSLANIEGGILDLQITKEGILERRWFKLASGAGQIRTLRAEQLAGLNRFAPADAQLLEARAPGEPMGPAVSQALFGRLPNLQRGAPQIPDHTSSSSDEEDEEEDGGGKHTGRYTSLDARFDKDVDDEQTQPAPSAAIGSGEQLEKSMAGLLGAISPTGYLELARSKTDVGKPFVRFERAVVIEMQSTDALDRSGLERMVTDELRARFVVKGVDPKLEWQEDAGIRYLAQSLMEQGSAYAVSDKFLVLSSSREFARDILKAGSAARTLSTSIEGPVEFYAQVRIALASSVFDKLMSKLDGRLETNSTGASDKDGEVKFFSENLPGLIAATAFKEMNVTRTSSQGAMQEIVSYSW
jgi:hypothetical protein